MNIGIYSFYFKQNKWNFCGSYCYTNNTNTSVKNDLIMYLIQETTARNYNTDHKRNLKRKLTEDFNAFFIKID